MTVPVMQMVFVSNVIGLYENASRSCLKTTTENALSG